jgi:hypothetical protein
VVVGDFPFVGKVGEASRLDSPQTYLAMYEARDPERFDPKLHEVIRAGFRGPYADTPTPRPPLAFIANDDFAPEIGEHIKLLLRADPRGNAFVRLTPHGTFEAPPWEFLLEARTLVIRHKSDPSRDRSVSVRPRFTGHRIEFEPEDSALNFEQLAKEPDHGGFFIRVRDQAFVAEIHEDARVHARYKGRRTIIPLTAVSEPQGPVDPLPYTPHPAELLVAGMQGPYVAQDGIQRIASYAARRMPVAGGVMASLGAMLLALASLVVWSNFAWRSGRTLAGAWFGIPLRTAILAVALAATNMALATALDFTHLTMGLLAIASLLAIVLVGPYRSPAS